MALSIEESVDDAPFVVDAGTGRYSARHAKLLEHRGPPRERDHLRLVPPPPAEDALEWDWDWGNAERAAELRAKRDEETRKKLEARTGIIRRRLSILAALGDYGAGKTYLGADFCFHAVTEWTWSQLEAMGFTEQSPPLGGFVAPNWDALLQGPVAKFFDICPPELISRRVLYPLNGRIELVTGWTINLYTAERMHPLRGGRGPTLCWIWADEIQDAKFAPKGLYRNIRKRARDRRAPRPFVLVTGIPYAGTHVQDLFDRPDTERRVTVILSTEDNAHNLHEDALDDIELDTPASMATKDARGWIILTSGTTWGNFNAANNVVEIDAAAAAKRVTHLGVDLRTHASVVFGQEIETTLNLAPGENGVQRTRKGKALVVVDQVMAEHKSAQRIAEEIAKQGKWKIGEGSEIWLDPTASIDECQAFRDAFPGAEVKQHKRRYYEERPGIECVDTRIADKHRNHRLLISKILEDDPSRRGVIISLRLYDGNRKSPFAHTADAVRYLVTGRLPLERHAVGGLGDPSAGDKENAFDVNRERFR